jgi:hypothetical protein
MKYLLLLLFFFLSLVLPAQTDSLRPIEPDRETSFENYELLVIALLGLIILMGMRVWFKRTRKH